MKEEKLRELLEKYYSGSTSDEEEAWLREYFSGEEILPGFETETDIFRYYSDSKGITPHSDNLEARILTSVDTLDQKLKIRIRRLIIYSAAASLLLLAGSYFFFTNRNRIEDTYTDPQIAYFEAKRVLYDVSLRLNKGTQALKDIAILNSVAEKSLIPLGKSADLISGQMEKIQHAGKLLGTYNNKSKE